MVTGDAANAMESLATERDRETSFGFEMGEIEGNVGESGVSVGWVVVFFVVGWNELCEPLDYFLRLWLRFFL